MRMRNNSVWFSVFFMAGLLIGSSSFEIFAQPAYRSDRIPLKCFMKEFMSISSGEISIIDEVNKKFSSWPLSEEHGKNAQKEGKMLFEGYKEKFQEVLKNYDSTIGQPLPKESPEQLEKLLTSSPIPDFKFSRSLGRFFHLAAYLKYREADYENAFRLLVLTYKFGQIIGFCDGEPSNLFSGMIGIALRKIAFSDLAWEILKKGDFSSEWYLKQAAELEKMRGKENPFSHIVEVEFKAMQNIIKHELLPFKIPNEENDEKISELQKVLGKCSESEQKELVKKILEKTNTFHQKLLGVVQKFETDFSAAKTEAIEISNSVEANAQPTALASMTISDQAYALILATSLPKLVKAYEHYRYADYRVQGMILLAKMLAAKKKENKLPTNVEEFKQMTGSDIPNDPFRVEPGPCTLKFENNSIILYSYGMNGADLNGDPLENMLIFRY